VKYAARVLIAAFPALLLADEAPFEFKGVPLGANEAAVVAAGYVCESSDTPLADRLCRFPFGVEATIAGAPAKMVLLFLYSDKVEMIGIRFDSDDFDQVKSALEQKYGEGVQTQETIQNRMGASFENRTVVWKRAGGTLEAKKYEGKVSESSVTFQTDQVLEEYARRRKETDQKAADDL
jgi:hypothetical protein